MEFVSKDTGDHSSNVMLQFRKVVQRNVWFASVVGVSCNNDTKDDQLSLAEIVTEEQYIPHGFMEHFDHVYQIHAFSNPYQYANSSFWVTF